MMFFVISNNERLREVLWNRSEIEDMGAASMDICIRYRGLLGTFKGTPPERQ